MFGKKYDVDYGDNQSLFAGAKSRYKAGTMVKFKVPVAKDARFYLYVDGDELKPLASSDSEFYMYEFKMPEHNVRISFRLDYNGSMPKETDEPVEVKPVMVVDYYEKPVAVVGGRGHFEMVLSTYGNDRAVLDVYDMPVVDGEEIHTSYDVPFLVVDEVLKSIMGSGMLDWNSKKGMVGITGRLFVCKFFYAGKYERVSSEHMPADGTAQFYAIKNILSKYIQKG